MNPKIYYGNTELTTRNIFDWKAQGYNCPTDDYTVGNVNDIVFTYTTDIKPEKVNGEYEKVAVGTEGQSGDLIYFRIKSVERLSTLLVRYSITCISDYNNLDKILPDTYATPVANETAWQLYIRLQGLSGISAPSSVPNGDYVINPNWYKAGLTYRQVFRWLCFLMGVNIRSIFANSNTLNSDRTSRFIPTTPDAQESDVLKFEPMNVLDIEMADYEVPQIDCIWHARINDTPLQYPQAGGSNPMYFEYNPLINPSDDSFITELYNTVSDLQAYTPMKIRTFQDAPTMTSNPRIKTPQIRSILYWSRSYNWMKYTIDNESYYCPIFYWELSPTGLILEGYGNITREDTNVYVSDETVSNAIDDAVVDSKIDEYDAVVNEKLADLQIKDLRGCQSGNYTTAATVSYDVEAGMYLVTTAQYGANNTASDGIWLTRVSSNNYHYSTILAPSDGTSVSVSANQITVNRGSAQTTISVIKVGG